MKNTVDHDKTFRAIKLNFGGGLNLKGSTFIILLEDLSLRKVKIIHFRGNRIVFSLNGLDNLFEFEFNHYNISMSNFKEMICADKLKITEDN